MGIGLGIVLVVLGLIPAAERRRRLGPRQHPGQALSFQLHEHAWRIVSVSQQEFAEVTESRCATCSAVAFSGPIRSALTASAVSRAFIRVRFAAGRRGGTAAS
jgi:hypothetical protein